MGLCPPGQKTTIEWQYAGETKQRIEGADDYSITPVHANATIASWNYHMGQAIFAASSFTPTIEQSCNPPERSPVRRCSNRIVYSGADLSAYHIEYYAPIYKYRVSERITSPQRCIPNGSQPLSIPCGTASGYRKVEILCHGTRSGRSLNPVWITAWWGKKNQIDTYLGDLLEVTHGGEFPVIYNSSTNRYEGLIPSSYNWNYFYFTIPNNQLPTGYLFQILKEESTIYQRTKVDKPVVTHFCGEKCPPGTCECTCGNRVCCHDPVTGAVIKSFIK